MPAKRNIALPLKSNSISFIVIPSGFYQDRLVTEMMLTTDDLLKMRMQAE
jgi:hypothetical protein